MAWISRKEAKERGLIRHSETRRVDPAPPPAKVPGVPPHKLARTYCLEIVTTTTTIDRRTHRFGSKRERDDFVRQRKKDAERRRPWNRYDRVDESRLEESVVDYREFMVNDDPSPHQIAGEQK